MSGFITAIIAEVFFAFAGIFYKLGIASDINPLTLVYGRLFTASIILILLWLVKILGSLPNLHLFPSMLKPGDWRSPLKIAFEDFFLFALLGIFFPASTLLLCIAIQSSSLATSNLLHNLTPVFIAIYCLLMLRKPSNKFMLLGLVTTFAGLGILEFPELRTDWSAFLSGGSAIAILSAVANACHVLVVGKLKLKGYSNFTILFWMSLLGAGYLLPLMMVEEIAIFPATEMGWLLIFGLGFLVQIIAQLLVLKSLNTLTPEIASSFFLLEPVMATILAYGIFGEQLTKAMLLGFMTILLGLFVLCTKTEPTLKSSKVILKPKLIS